MKKYILILFLAAVFFGCSKKYTVNVYKPKRDFKQEDVGHWDSTYTMKFIYNEDVKSALRDLASDFGKYYQNIVYSDNMILIRARKNREHDLHNFFKELSDSTSVTNKK